MKNTCLVLTLTFLMLGQVIAQSTISATKNSIPQNLTLAESKFEEEVLAEINKMRTNPQEYAKIIEAYLKTFKGKDSTTPDGVEIMTNEGTVPVEEVIAALKSVQPMAEFKVVEELNKAAKDHALDLTKTNKTGHRGSDGSMPMERVEKYGAISQISENISYFSKTARAVVLTMLIDDGTPSRNHRKNLLSSTHTVIGIASGENKAGGKFCVILFTNKFTPNKGGLRSF